MTAYKTCRNPQCPKPGPRPLDDFHGGVTTRDGHLNVCKTCRRAQMREYYYRSLRRARKHAKRYDVDQSESASRIEALLNRKGRLAPS